MLSSNNILNADSMSLAIRSIDSISDGTFLIGTLGS